MNTKLKRHRGNNIFGISTEFIRDPATFPMKYEKELGSFFKLTLPLKNDFIVSTDANFVEHIAIKNEKKYPKSKIHWEALKKLLGKSVLTTEGEDWKYLRQLHQQTYTKGNINNILKETEQVTRSYLSYFNQIDSSSEINVHIATIIVEITLKSILGIQICTNYSHFAQMVKESESILNWRTKYPWRPILGWLNGKNQKLFKSVKEIDRFTDKIIEQQSPCTETLIGRLLEEYWSKKITKEVIRNEIMFSLGAASEILANILTWALVLIKEHPINIEKITSEIESISNGSPISYKDTEKLIYTSNVILETIRINSPSFSILRECIEDDEYNGYRIKKGDSIYISIYSIHHSEEYWNQPFVFIPERFYDHKLKHRFAFMPFGAGKHTCIARYLVIPQLTWMLAFFIQNYEIIEVNKENLEMITEIFLKPKNLFVTLKNKNQQFNENTIS